MHRSALIALLSLLATVACDDGRSAGVPRPWASLGGELRSGMTLQEVDRLAGFSGCPWVVEKVDPRPQTPQPILQRVKTTVSAAACTHLGMPGRIQMEFANDRLMAVEFIPIDPGNYRAAVEREIGAPSQLFHNPLESKPHRMENGVYVTMYEEAGRTLWTDGELLAWYLSE